MNKLRTQNDKNTLKNAFSLLEMMVVLLIVSILAAATAPMVTKKMARSTGTGDSPWVFTGLNSSIAYNLNGNDNAPVIIGATSTPASLTAPTRLFIDSGNTASHIAFGNGNAVPLGITADPNNGRIGITNATVPRKSVAFGDGQTLPATQAGDQGYIAIGSGVTVTERQKAIAIGDSAYTNGQGSIAIGWVATANDNNNSREGAIAIGASAQATAKRAIAIGRGAQATGDYSNAIGTNSDVSTNNATKASGKYSVAIGYKAQGLHEHSVAIGSDATAGDKFATLAIGRQASATGENSLAIGLNAQATATNSLAIGTNAKAQHAGSVAIGVGAETDYPNQIRLGGEYDTVVIPGNLIVDKGAVLGARKDSSITLMRFSNHVATGFGSSGGVPKIVETNDANGIAHDRFYSSDRRLKNVGEAYTAGLDELKKLDFFHYTFKKDEAKTPHVGVMAQDLEKVFPDAVTKGEDGYLRIRMEDMFYAVINAVKELDTKITEIVENVTSLSKKVDEQEKTIAEQQKLIEDLEQRLAQVEKKKLAK